ncbi:ABC transporter substrate-binding protein [Kocuria sp. M1R5S2]|uniref:ABC transporter substrate-binding protein n=1 Tax=Kocuria rhizosphaerae TaxID=3376285 RepID=UPI00379B6642
MELSRSAAVVLAVGAALSVTACGGGGGVSASASDGELEKTEVTVGALPLADYAAVYWAKEQGFFEDEGLTVTLEPLQGGSIGAQRVASGELDFSFSNTISTALATQSGMPIKTVALTSALGDDTLSVYVKPDSPIRSMEDLDGKNIGINTTNNIGDVTFRALAASEGVDVEPTFVEVPFNEMLAGVEAGSIDAGYAPEPFASAAEEAGMREVVDLSSGPNAGLAVSNFVTSDSFINENPDTTDAFIRAVYAAGADIEANKDEFRTWLPEIANVPAETASSMALPTFLEETDVDEIQKVAEMMIDQGILEEGYDAAEHTYVPAES